MASSFEVTVVGTGAAGLSAALEASKTAHRVLVLEKTSGGGGNSAKASSGINGAESSVQHALNISDEIPAFIQDTVRAGQNLGNKELVGKLCLESNSAIQFLINEIELPLSDVIQLGGHSAPRTHRLRTHAPIGFSMIKALKRKLEERTNVHFEYNSEVIELIWDDTESNIRSVRGVVYRTQEHDLVRHYSESVILATGGMAHSMEDDGLFSEFAPELRGLATSSGDQADGSGMVMGRKAGAELVQMEHVQLHPTGLVDPKTPASLSKILGPEALRGVGGILVLKNGKRFVNELARRGHVASEIRFKGDVSSTLESGREQATAHILLNREAMEEFSPQMFSFYVGKGIFKFYNNFHELSLSEGIDSGALASTLEAYNLNVDGVEDEFGKTKFPVSFNLAEPIWVGQVTPVIHYTMGGLRINTQAEVLHANGQIMNGLFAAGECTGGVHGGDRLAGNSLLECVVMGRTAGASAAQVCSTTKVGEL